MMAQLTERAGKVMALASQEARRLKHTNIGTEHILLGIVSEGTGVAANVLVGLGADAVRREIETLVVPGTEDVAVGEMSLTPRAMEAMALAAEESRALNHNYVGTEHLLLGLLRVSAGGAAQALTNLGLDLESVRQEVFSLLGASHRRAPAAEAAAALGAGLKQFVVTPSMGKRLIGKALAVHPAIRAVLRKGTLVIVAGTTNGYVAEEVLKATRQAEGFTRRGFRRGMVTPPGFDAGSVKVEFPGDVVLIDGAWQRGKQVFDVVDDLGAGDVILKGANALDLRRGHAAVYIGDPQGGTAAAAVRAAVGRRVQLIVPVGLEKRVAGNVTDLAAELNAAGAEGPRMLPLPGRTFTELDAIAMLTGAAARLVAAGGVYGAEGCAWIAVSGEPAQLRAAADLIESVASEPLCEG